CNIILAKYDPNGNLLWEKQSKDKGIWVGVSLSADINGHIYMGASSTGDSLIYSAYTLPLPSHKITNSYAFILEFDTSGNAINNGVLINGVAAPYQQYHIDMAADSSGNFIYLAGTFVDDTVFTGPDTLLDRNGGTLPYYARWAAVECVPQINSEGINNLQSNNSGVVLYPNPSNGKFAIEVRNEELSEGIPIGKVKSTVEVFNMLGEKICSSSFSIYNSTFNINLGSQSNGIYLYRVLNENGELAGEGKFVINK
ncbi:MAG TPA: T9SS type A sorting domain-containing protein, partial [Bacteroidia bacterium]|nr:T9SS type A sorting domain-containing protein [Bacteroidia bacterium]